MTHSFKRFMIGLSLFGLMTGSVMAERPPLAELWLQTSAEYRALSYQAYQAAGDQFERWDDLLVQRDGKAYLPGSAKPVAIILDLDETVIDNSGFQAFTIKSNTEYHPDLWTLWVEFQGVNTSQFVMPGAVEFLAKAKALGVTPFFISNRTVGQEAATIKVLERAGIDVQNIDKRLLLRLENDKETERGASLLRAQKLGADSPDGVRMLKGEGKKEARRQMVRKEYDVIAYFGDVLGDFEPYVQMADDSRQAFQARKAQADHHHAYWGRIWFILPNPMYGSWAPGETLPKEGYNSALEDYGFGVYVRGRRAPVTAP